MNDDDIDKFQHRNSEIGLDIVLRRFSILVVASVNKTVLNFTLHSLHGKA